jgi:hypothetical protein
VVFLKQAALRAEGALDIKAIVIPSAARDLPQPFFLKLFLILEILLLTLPAASSDFYLFYRSEAVHRQNR